MAQQYGPKVVTDGLVLCLDAADKNSYPGSGTTWSDLSGNNYDATLSAESIGTTTDGWMDWGSSDNANYVSIPKEALDGLSSWTLEFALYISSTSITNGINTLLSCGAENNFMWYLSDHSAIHTQNVPDVSLTYATSTATNFLMTVTGTGGGSGTYTGYKNGVLGSTITQNTVISVPGTFAEIALGQEYDNNTTGGFDNGQAWLGKMGIVRFYNRVLTAAEISQNFNAQRSRFSV